MQTCSDCKIELNEATGYTKTKGKFQAKCKSCFNAYCIKRWRQRKVEAVAYKGGCCAHCGYNKSMNALEFHHIDPNEKETDWSRLRLKSLDKIHKELDKCVLLCSNCHREEHDEFKSLVP